MSAYFSNVTKLSAPFANTKQVITQYRKHPESENLRQVAVFNFA